MAAVSVLIFCSLTFCDVFAVRPALRTYGASRDLAAYLLDSREDGVSPSFEGSPSGARRSPERKKPTAPPNIIFLLADDLGWNDVSYHGKAGSLIETPFIDRLAHKGLRLENYYVQPVCSPTRSQLMTGRYQIRMGIQHTNFSPGENLCLPLNETLLPEKLKEGGYATHAIGKWHLGMAKRACLPTRRGFDSFFGIILGTSDHEYYQHATKVKMKDGKKDNWKGNTFYENEEPTAKYYGKFSAELYAERAAQIMREHDKSKPLFLYVPFQMVHRPNKLPKKYLKKYRHTISDKDRRFYAARVSALDMAVKHITRALLDYGLYENSVIIFSTDNGGSVKQMASNWPLRGGKGQLWEGGTKAVGFVHSPLIPKRLRGSAYRGLMHATDWLPTLVQGVAGLNLKTMPNQLDGYNLWKSIRTNRTSPRMVLLHNINPHKRGVSDWRPKDTVNWGKLEKLPFNATIRAAIRIGKWKLLTGKVGRGELYLPEENPSENRVSKYKDRDPIKLYNVVKDPSEINNLALKHPEKVFKMLRRLKHFHGQSMQPLPYHVDPLANPRLHNNSWAPWLED